MIDKTTIEIEDLRTHLTEAQGKLFEAGRFAGLQQLVIDKQGAAMTEALLMLEQAHSAAHQGEMLNCLAYVAQAMEILAND